MAFRDLAEVGLTDSPCGTFSAKLRALPDMICMITLYFTTDGTDDTVFSVVNCSIVFSIFVLGFNVLNVFKIDVITCLLIK